MNIIKWATNRLRSFSANPATCNEGDIGYNTTTHLPVIATATNTWTNIDTGTAYIVGPASSTDNAIVRFDGPTGVLVQNSAVTIADTNGNVAGVGTLNTHTIPGGTDTFALLAASQTLTNKTLTSPIITNIAPGANFTLTQNSVAVITSENTSATLDTLHLKAGTVGIGSASPQSILELKAATPVLTFNQQTNNSEQGLNFNAGTSVIGSLTYNSNFGIMTLNSGLSSFGGAIVFKLDTVEQMRLTASTGVLKVVSLAGTGSRAVLADASGNLSAPVSDARLKTNIQPLKNALDKVTKLRGISFDFIATKDIPLTQDKHPQVGMIAQEVENIIPEAVGFNAPVNGTAYRYINYDVIIPFLVEAAKAQQKEIQQLKKELCK